MGNEISGRQTDVHNKYGIDVYSNNKWYHNHYIEFLLKEIEGKTWETKYKNAMNHNGTPIIEPAKQFCKWKEIQKEIFESVLDNHRFLLYTWEDRAKHLIEQAQHSNYPRETCGEEKEQINNSDVGTTLDENTNVNDTKQCSLETINMKGLLPRRRAELNKRLKNIYEHVNNILNYNVGSNTVKARMAATTVIGSLANQTKNEIDEVMKNKSQNNRNICKILGRTYADYKDLSKGQDIVKDKLSEELQCFLKKVTDEIGESEMKQLWEEHFKKPVEEKLMEMNIYEDDSNDLTNRKKCTLDHSDEQRPQCFRYYEEWIEDFINENKYIENRTKIICNNKIKLFGIRNDLSCSGFCGHYKKFLDGRKDNYKKFKTLCAKNLEKHEKYSIQHVFDEEINDIERQFKKTINPKGLYGNSNEINLDKLFDSNNNPENKIYNCYCGNGKNNPNAFLCNEVYGQIDKGYNISHDNLKANLINVSFIENNIKDSIKDVCELDSGRHTFSYIHPCGRTARRQFSNIWLCDKTNNKLGNGKETKNGCLSPRRQHLCIHNIGTHNLDLNKFDEKAKDKLFVEVVNSAKQEGSNLSKRRKGNEFYSYDKICQNIKNSFFDLGDIIKGNDMVKDEISIKVQQNLENIFEKVRVQWKNENNNSDKYDDINGNEGTKELRKDWWNANKEEIWKAMTCGIKNGKYEDCGNNNTIPTGEEIPQFLRWYIEWSNDFCSEKKHKQNLIDAACKDCGDDSCENSFWWSWFSSYGTSCDCKYQCKRYANFIDEKKYEYSKQQDIYNKLKTIPAYTSVIGSSSKNAAIYLKDKVSKEKCNDINFEKEQKTFSSYPEGIYRSKCNKCNPQMEVYLTDEDSKEIDPCKVNKILTSDPGSNLTHKCDGDINKTLEKKPKSKNGENWLCDGKNEDTNNNNICVPSRYKEICTDTIENNSVKNGKIDEQNYYNNSRMLLSELILVAQHEGKLLWDLYVNKADIKDKYFRQNEKTACTTMKRTFSDIGDLIKGTNISNGYHGKTAKYLNTIFKKLKETNPNYDTKYEKGDPGLKLFRKDWWEANKDPVWEAFVCDGRNKECGNHGNMDRIPQFLRWLEEWSEEFCKERKNKLTDMKNDCEACRREMRTKTYDVTICESSKCKECKEKCQEYKSWKKNWKNNWDKLKDYYNEEKNNVYGVLKSYVNDKEIEDFVKKEFNDKCEYDKILNDSGEYLDTPYEYNAACECSEKIELAKKAETNTTYSHDVHNKLGQNICHGTFDKGWIEWDCNAIDIGKNRVCKIKNDNDIDIDNEFNEWFEEWLKSFLDEYSQFEGKVADCIDNKNGNTNICLDEKCRDKCYCYNKWASKRKLEWELLQTYYDDYNKKNPDIFGSLTVSDFLDTYLQVKFDEEFENLNGTLETPKQQMISKFNDAVMKSEKCVEKCPKKLSCEEKGFVTGWECEKTIGNSNNDKICVKKGENKYAKPNLSAIGEIDRFYDTFNDWINDIEHMLEENMKLLHFSCNKKNPYINKSPNICFRCKNDCECYEILKGEIKTQWEKLQKYYDHYKNEEKSKMKDIDLDTYLEAKCELDATEKGKDESEAEELCRKKNTSSGSDHTIFDEMLDNTNYKKTKICDVCKERDKYDTPVDENTCNKIHDANNCNEKTFHGLKNDGKEEKEWLCKNNKTPSTEFVQDVCVPPRGQSICIANMVDGKGDFKTELNEEKHLLKHLKDAMRTETKYLWMKFGQKDTENDKTCRYIYRSFNDFKHMVLGDSLWKPESIKKLQDKIGEIIQKSGISRDQWWKDNEKDFWNAVKCGIKEATKPQNGGNECVRFISDDDQFEWWAKEWSDDFYDKRKELVGQVKAACNGSNGCSGSSNTPNGVCGIECGKYKDFLTHKRKEWTNNFQKYLEQTPNQDKYSPHNFYLLYPCTYQSCDGTHIKDLLGNKEHGEYENKCTCTTSPTTEEKNPCSDKFEFHACTGKKYDLGSWSSLYVKNQTDRGKVFAPPRRNSICIGWLFSPINKTDKENAKEELKNKIIYAAKGETHYLWDYYRKKNGSTTTTSPPPGYCEYLKRSFADIGDMVKGTDMWMAGYSSHVENNIQSIFELDNDGNNGKLIKTKEELLEERKQFWEEIREEVWTAMNCKDNNCNGTTIPSDDDVPQFLRWLEEWGEYICEERDKQMRELADKCKESVKDITKDTGCASASTACKQQCAKYNNWINIYKREWLGQKSKYKEIYDNKDYKRYVNTHQTSNEYIKSKCDKCKTTHKSGDNHINVDEVFKKIDKDYKEYEPFCTTCRMKDIAKKAKENTRVNPCGHKTKPTRSVKQVAKEMKTKAENEAQSHDTDSKLKGDISQAKFGKDGNASQLGKDEICQLDKTKHTNDERQDKDRLDGPCQGKGGKDKDRFNIGKKWEPQKNKVNAEHSDVLFPPRRLDMCTSNLEYLNTNSGPLNDPAKVNDSFLGDVLLAAKEEAQSIIDLYKDKNGLKTAQVPLESNHQRSICYAMRSSFADLGDIIRGRDIWTKENGNKQLQDHLRDIFAKIKDNATQGSTYKTEASPYTNMRNHWWALNRDQVWTAMDCALKQNNITIGDCQYKFPYKSPHDDYIPQRLRWMTEWAEWYCKKQSQLYTTLQGTCGECKNISKGGTCAKCKECKAECDKYQKEIKQWETQWTEMERKYKDLYTKAKDGEGKDENEKYLNTFLHKLRTQNSGNTTYASAAGYVHHVLKDMECVQQTKFCRNNNTQDYAFMDKPHGYDGACKCTEPAIPSAPLQPQPQPQPQPVPGSSGPQGQKDACQIAEEVLNSKDKSTGKIAWCGPKDTPKNWDCNKDSFKDKNEGPCMPPRRQTLCIKNLATLDDKTSTEDLRKALIQCSSIETYWLWEKYKGTHSGVEDKLKNQGIIPDDFKRRMFYTYGYFQDLILDKDIGKLAGDVEKARKNIDRILKPQNVGKISDKDRQTWWDGIKEDVWKGMLCALSYSGGTDDASRKEVKQKVESPNNNNTYDKVTFDGKTPISQFIQRPQFLRWLTEWGEDFCRQQKSQLDILDDACKGCEVENGSTPTCKDDSKCTNCKTQCGKYKDFITQWTKHYESQNKKFKDEKDKDQYKTADTDVTGTNTAREYLHKKLEKMCDKSASSGNCEYTCMDEESAQLPKAQNGNEKMPKSLDEYPTEDYKTKCNCPKPAAPKHQDTSTQGQGPGPGQQPPSGGSSAGPGQADPNKAPSVPANSDPRSGSLPSPDPGTPGTGTSSNKSNHETDECGGLSVSGSNFPDSSVFGGGSAPVYKCSAYHGIEIEPTNCVEKSAYLLRKGAENIINKELKINTMQHIFQNCKNIDDFIEGTNGYMYINKNKLDSAYPTIDSCPNEGTDRLDVGKTWRCNNINRRQKNLCLPPRRQYMCIKKIENMMSSNIENNETFLKGVMEAAKDEAIDILKKLQSTKEHEFSNICDAMKYSFADIGDIIRGRDLWNDNRTQQGIQTRLQKIFRNIYDKLEYKDKYKHDGGNFYTLRSDWWNANRRNIWKAMTCVAPEGAKLYRKEDKKDGKNIGLQKCGYHNDSPPDYDYIPQPFRWMQEWSEYFCKARTDLIKKLSEICKECIASGNTCNDDDDGKKCKECKKTCQEHNDFIQQWKQQLDKQSNMYNEFYQEAYENSVNGRNTTITSSNYKTMKEIRKQGGRHRSRNFQNEDNNKRIDNFLKEMSKNCDNIETADKYLYKATHCNEYTFLAARRYYEKYAFTDVPNNVKRKCNCEFSTHPMDKCPFNVNNNHCNDYGSVRRCINKRYENDLNNWSNKQILHNSGENYGVLLPPRRKELCIGNLRSNIYTKDDVRKKKMHEDILTSAFNEGKLLRIKYSGDKDLALQEMKYSFADYSDIIKGTDMMEISHVDNIGQAFNKISERSKWWEENRTRIWNAMLCGYKDAGGNLEENDCHLPDDKTSQFLRWLKEWGKQACKEKNKQKENVNSQCNDSSYTTPGSSKSSDTYGCKTQTKIYNRWNTNAKLSLDQLNIKYKKYISTKKESFELTVEEYLKKNCPECTCNFQDIFDTFQTSVTNGNIHEDIVKKSNIKENILISRDDSRLSDIIYPAIHASMIGTAAAMELSKEAGFFLLRKLKSLFPSHVTPDNNTHNDTASSDKGTQKDQPDITNNILSSTLPVGISFALGSIALLFYLKKKPKTSPVDIFRVIDIPQNDYNIPDETSTNRYIPYRSQYKGKTYIYVERDGDSEDDKYMFTSDTTDVTSSESEYEEIDINDIYPYKSPKYKTLIEVVLKPTKNGDTSNSGDIPSDIPNSGEKPFSDNIPIEEEWNEVKQDFILNMLQNDIPGNITDTNTSYSGMPLEKPFITQIQDRKLYSDNDVFSYNINWNIPKNITTNNATYNSLYSGIDLINDSLNSDNDIDIYDELLKRKENELYGTKYTKNTSTNIFAKPISGDPILNQLDLYDKWLERNRDMYNQWNIQRDNDNTTDHTHKLLNTNLSIEISSDDIPRSNMDMSDTNRYTYFDDMELFQYGSDENL